MVEFVRAAALSATVASAYMLGSARCAVCKGKKSLLPSLSGATKVWYIVLAIALVMQYMQMNAY